MGSAQIHAELLKRFGNERTSLGEVISVVQIDRSDGVVEHDEVFMQHGREAAVKEYFFGDARRTLSPLIQQVDFDNVVIYKVSDRKLALTQRLSPLPSPMAIQSCSKPKLTSSPASQGLVKETPSTVMQHWTLAIMHASPKDPPETVRAASVMGFVYVSDVDEERRKIKLLSTVSGRLGDKPLVWGKWPEPYINLLG